MQKTPLFHIIREEVIRAIVFVLTLITIVLAGIATTAFAADGGLFGQIMNKILASGDWQNPGDGTVKNALKVGGIDPSQFIKIKPGQSCGTNQCIKGFNPDGTVQCQ